MGGQKDIIIHGNNQTNRLFETAKHKTKGNQRLTVKIVEHRADKQRAVVVSTHGARERKGEINLDILTHSSRHKLSINSVRFMCCSPQCALLSCCFFTLRVELESISGKKIIYNNTQEMVICITISSMWKHFSSEGKNIKSLCTHTIFIHKMQIKKSD